LRVEHVNYLTMKLPDIPLYDLKSYVAEYEEEFLEVAADVIRSGNYVNGVRTETLKHELSSFLGGIGVHFVGSGTDALIIGMRSLGLKENSKVISVANAGGYAAIAGMQLGCKMIFCDIDPNTHLICIDSLRVLVDETIDAVVITHLYGNMVDTNEVHNICEKFGIKVIEDYAQSFGGIPSETVYSKRTKVYAFSFYPTKNLAALGDAGAIASHDVQIMDRAKKYSQYGWSQKYEIELPKGVNSRIDEIQAGFISINLSRVKINNQLRRNIITNYNEIFIGSNIKVVTRNSVRDTAHLCVIKIPNEVNRSALIRQAADFGISLSIHYPHLDHQQSGLAGYFEPTSLPVSEQENKNILTIPCFPFMTTNQISRVADFLLNSRLMMDKI
jgi:aminotransferase EvaB